MTRKQLVTTVAAATLATNTPPARVSLAVSEWLSEHPAAGSIFDAAGWDLRRFVTDVERHRKELATTTRSNP